MRAIRSSSLLPHPGDHRLRQVDAVHVDAASGERKCDTPRPDTEFPGAAATGKPGENVDDGVDDALVVHARRRGIVGRGDLLAEVPVVVGHV